MPSGKAQLAVVAITLAGAACVLPGAVSPTPFIFPTPNLTLTAIFGPTSTQPTTETALVESPSPRPFETETTATSTPPEFGLRPNGHPATAERIASPPAIDGDLGEWTSDLFSANEVTFGAGSRTGGSDLSAVYRLAWDSQALYIGLQVTDDRYVQEASGATLYRGDSAEILVDTNLGADFNSSSLSSDDYQIGFSAGGDLQSGAGEAYRWFPASRSSSLSLVDLAARRTPSGYTLEIRLPWAELEFTPSAGDQLGFVLSVSDNDQPNTAEQQSLVSSVSTRVLADPTTWGTLLLTSD